MNASLSFKRSPRGHEFSDSANRLILSFDWHPVKGLYVADDGTTLAKSWSDALAKGEHIALQRMKAMRHGFSDFERASSLLEGGV